MFNHSPEGSKLNLNISLLTTFKVTGVVLLMILSIQFISSILTIILLFFTALFLAIALNPSVTKISLFLKIKNRVLATSIAFGTIVLILASLFVIILPPVISQVSRVATNLPDEIKEFQDQDNFISNIVNDNQFISEWAEDVAGYFTGDINNFFDVLQTIGSTVGALIVVLVMTFMILLEGPIFMKQIKHLIPKERSKKWQRLGKEMSVVISGYITGQILIAFIAGLFAMLFMTILANIFNLKEFGWQDALAMSAIVSFCALIPLIGAILGAAIVVILTFLISPNLALILLIYFVVYQQIENATIQPWIQGQQTNLSVLQVFIVALIGAQIAGIIGVLLAIPVAACLKIILIDYLKTNKDYIERKYLANPGSRRNETQV